VSRAGYASRPENKRFEQTNGALARMEAPFAAQPQRFTDLIQVTKG